MRSRCCISGSTCNLLDLTFLTGRLLPETLVPGYDPRPEHTSFSIGTRYRTPRLGEIRVVGEMAGLPMPKHGGLWQVNAGNGNRHFLAMKDPVQQLSSIIGYAEAYWV